MQRIFTLAILLLSSFASLAAQTWIPVGNEWAGYTVTAPVTMRIGYPGTEMWITKKITAAGKIVLPDTSSLKSSGHLEVDIQQTAVTVTVSPIWNGGSTGCSTTATYKIPPTGKIPDATFAPCPGSTRLTASATPTAPAKKAAAPEVTPPPVAAPPVVVTQPIAILPTQGTVSVDAAGNITVVFPAGAAVKPGTCAVGNAGSYSLAICSGLPVLQTVPSHDPQAAH